jgi:hypothetical protein
MPLELSIQITLRRLRNSKQTHLETAALGCPVERSARQATQGAYPSPTEPENKEIYLTTIVLRFSNLITSG